MSSATSKSPAISIRGLSHDFGGPRVLDSIDLEVSKGEFVVLLGRSGTGKSTLLRLLAGLDNATSGSFEVPENIGVAFQEPRLLPWKKVWANVVYGLPGRSKRELREVALAALGEVELSPQADAWPLTLSGGQAQRASLARALVRTPELLLLDEPFGALDALTRLTMQDLVLDLWRNHGLTVVMVTHDIGEAARLADRVLVLDSGRFLTDVRVEAERPRRTDDLRVAEVEGQLAESLGVRH